MCSRRFGGLASRPAPPSRSALPPEAVRAARSPVPRRPAGDGAFATAREDRRAAPVSSRARCRRGPAVVSSGPPGRAARRSAHEPRHGRPGTTPRSAATREDPTALASEPPVGRKRVAGTASPGPPTRAGSPPRRGRVSVRPLTEGAFDCRLRGSEGRAPRRWGSPGHGQRCPHGAVDTDGPGSGPGRPVIPGILRPVGGRRLSRRGVVAGSAKAGPRPVGRVRPRPPGSPSAASRRRAPRSAARARAKSRTGPTVPRGWSAPP